MSVTCRILAPASDPEDARSEIDWLEELSGPMSFKTAVLTLQRMVDAGEVMVVREDSL